jgi:urease accessory protein
MTPRALLGLMRLASPALPVGGFSYSEGLEAAVEAAVVHDEASAAAWLDDQLHLTVARAELPLVAAAHDAWTRHDAPRIADLNAWALTTRETGELRAQCEQMGRSMLDWIRRSAVGNDTRVDTLAALPVPAWPIAFALAAVQADADARGTALACGFCWAESQVQAALKAVPLGQSAGQRILGRLAEALPALVEQAMTMRDEDRMAFAPQLALRSAQHETQYSRLFRS